MDKLRDKYFLILLSIIFNCLLLFVLPVKVNAQIRELLFQKITTDNGLSNNLINCIIQDSNGYMWFGSDEGLNRYDGYENKVFKKRLYDTTSLSDNHIVSLFVDSKKRLWIGTLNGLCLYDEDKENFETYWPNKANAKMNTVNRIIGIEEVAGNKIFVCTEEGILYAVENKKLIVVKNFNKYGSSNTKHFIIDKFGKFWVGCLNGLIYFDPISNQTSQISIYNNNGINFEFTQVNTIFEGKDTIWLGTNSGQFGYILTKTHNAEILNFSKTKLNIIFNIHKDFDNFFYIATDEGLYILDKNKKLISTYKYYQNNPYGISSNTLLNIYKDKQENLWVASTQGINLAMNGKAFNNYSFYSQKIKLDITDIQSLNIDSKGNIWLGSFNRGMNVINLVTCYKKLFMPDPNNPYSIGGASVINLFEDSRKNMWVGTFLGYLQRYDPSSDRFISYTFNHIRNEQKEVKDIRSMVEDKNGILWIICHGFGLFKFNPENNQYKIFTRNPNDISHSLADNWAYQVLLDSDSILWIATPSGLSRFNINTESFINYYNNPDDSTSLSNNHINVVFGDSKKNIWVGTFFGLNLLNKKNNSFYHFFENDGLPSNQIKSFVEEKPGRIWIGTGYGLTCMDYSINDETGKPKVKFINYNRSDNLQDVFFWERSAVKTKEGELVFGTENGFVIFHPNEIKDNPTPPNVLLTDFYLYNKKINIGGSDSILHHNINNLKEIKLRYNQNFISFKFVAINYISPENNQYAYFMEGSDKDWNYVGTKREATYTNLDHGEYIFKVKASNNDGVWNKQETSVKIIILPPWWKTWWFRTIIYISLLVLIILGYYSRIAFYENQQKKLKILVQDRTIQLEEAAVSMEEKQEEINSQKEELVIQKNELENSNKQIIEQNIELDRHRNQLELLIEERTKELYEAKEKAEESDKLKSSFLANLSHEIRTPLNAILGFSSLLSDIDLSNEVRKSYNEIIQQSSDSLLELISDILDISKIEAGQMELILKEASINELVRDLIETFNMLTKRQDTELNKNVSLKVNIQEKIKNIQIVTDRHRLMQILSNLISNAIKYTSEGYIEVGCRKVPDEEMLEFYVKDTGIGIKEENLKIIFERFRKVENENIQYRGTGLGLAISHQLVNLMGGKINLNSKLGQGSIFYFTIPLVKSESTLIHS